VRYQMATAKGMARPRSGSSASSVSQSRVRNSSLRSPSVAWDGIPSVKESNRLFNSQGICP